MISAEEAVSICKKKLEDDQKVREDAMRATYALEDAEFDLLVTPYFPIYVANIDLLVRYAASIGDNKVDWIPFPKIPRRFLSRLLSGLPKILGPGYSATPVLLVGNKDGIEIRFRSS